MCVSRFLCYRKLMSLVVVLGSPGSGCTSLLKTLANQRAEYHTITGEVYYDSITSEALEKQYRGDVIFCPEDDIHLPTLTVEQTIKFAAACRAPHLRAGLSKEEYINSLTDLLLRVFGLTEVRHTKVGDAAIRGVSGGQKKRVSICEALAARANIISWDGYVMPVLCRPCLIMFQYHSWLGCKYGTGVCQGYPYSHGCLQTDLNCVSLSSGREFVQSFR